MRLQGNLEVMTDLKNQEIKLVEAVVYKDREPFLGVDRAVQSTDHSFTRNYQNYLKIMNILGLQENDELTDEAVEHFRQQNQNLKSESLIGPDLRMKK